MRSLFVQLSVFIAGCTTFGDPFLEASNGDADSHGDVYTDVDADGDGDDEVNPNCEAQRCDDDWACCQESCERTQLRITSLRLTSPWALAMTQDLIDESLDDYRFPWLIELDLARERVRLGAGTIRADPPDSREDFCSDAWTTDEPPSSWGSIEFDGSTFSTTSPLDAATIDQYAERTHLQTLELRLKRIELLYVALNESHTLVGSIGAHTQGTLGYATGWESTSIISAWIEWNDAQEAWMPTLGMTLCDNLCERDCGEMASPDVCITPPVQIPGTSDLGWEFRAAFGAGAINIFQNE